MLDPISMIVAVLVNGILIGMQTAAENAVTDSYKR
jgi:hypothetical protein